MTVPPDGTPQPYGQQPYPQQPGPYGQPAYQAPQPGYQPPPPGYQPPPGYPVAPGYPAPGVPGSGARPGMVTAAAVLSFIWGGFSVIGALIAMAGGAFFSAVSTSCVTDSTGDADLDAALGNLCDASSSAGGFFIVTSIVLIVAAGLLIWGGVVALNGKNAKIGVIAAGLLILAQIISLIASSGMSIGFVIFGLIVPVLIIVFLINKNSKAWFQSKGGATF